MKDILLLKLTPNFEGKQSLPGEISSSLSVFLKARNTNSAQFYSNYSSFLTASFQEKQFLDQ